MSTADPEPGLAALLCRLQETNERLDAERERCRRAEAALAHANQQLSSILESISDGFFVLDGDLRLTHFNAAAERLLGRERQDVLGKHLFREAFPEAAGSIFELHYARAMRERRPLSFETFFGVAPYDDWYDVRVYPHNSGIAVYFLVTSEQRQTERALAQERNLVARITEASPAGIVLVDRDGRITFANPAAERVLGLSRDRVTGRTYNDPQWRISAIDGGPFPDECLPFRQVLRGEPVHDARHAIEWPDGRRVLLSINGLPLLDEAGRVEGMVATVEDITEQWNLAEEREVTVALLRLLNVHNTVDQLMREVAHLLGSYTGCEAVGIRLRDGDDYPYLETRGFPEEFVRAESHLCLTGLDGLLVRDGAGNPVLDCMCGNVLRGRFDPSKPFFTENGSFWTNSTTELLASTSEQDRRSRTRNRCNGEGYESVALVPLRTEGETFGLLQLNDRRKGMFTPALIALLERLAVSLALGLSRKRAEAALRDSEGKFRGMVEQTADGIVIVDETGKITEWNPAQERITGLAAAQAVGRPLWEVQFALAPEEKRTPEAYAALRQTIATGLAEAPAFPWQDRLIEKEIQRQDGHRRTIQTLVFPIQSDRGFMTGSIIRDVTERRRLEEQLRQSQKMETVGRLAGGIAHDFNNLLTAIAGHASFAQESLSRADPAREDIALVLQAAERASNLTRQLLAFSRRQIIAPRVLNLNELILNMDRLLRRLIGENIELVTVPEHELWSSRIDPGQIEQVIVNLAVNARDAMPNGGKLTIETANVVLNGDYARAHVGAIEGEFVMLAVSDTGTGIAPEVREHLFEPFFTTKEHGRGTGLGLATVYGIVKQHGGNIWVYSEVGEGTSFKIYLPRAAQPVTHLPQRDEQSNLPRGSETILVVEDEALVRRVAARILSQQGYRVLEATNGPEALRLIAAHSEPVHLLLTDVVMPQMSGKELAEQLQSAHPEMAVLFTSGYTDNAIVHHGVLDPGRAFLQKPFTAASLARRVRDLLDGR